MANPFQFLKRVVPWGDGYVNVHWFIDKNGRQLCRGTPVQDPGRALDVAMKRDMATDTALGVYVCMSLQSQTETISTGTGNSFEVAKRVSANVLGLKSLYLDIDVKNYAGERELILDFMRWRKETKLPPPNIIVDSGSGGKHIYWVLDRTLTLEEWHPLATALKNACIKHGLQADHGVTADSVRILRVPGTTHRKTGNRVTIKHWSDVDIDTTVMEQALFPFAGATLHTLPLRNAPAVQDNVGAGINEFAPVPLEDLTPECGFLRDALTTGGKDYDEPLWDMTVLAAVHTVGGRADAHRMSSGHAEYDVQATDDKFTHKERSGAKWPTCATVHSRGSKPCTTCPHLQLGKTPFHFATLNGAQASTRTGAASSSAAGQTPSSVAMPSGYWPSASGSVMTASKGSKTTPSYNFEIAPYVFLDAARLAPDGIRVTVDEKNRSFKRSVDIPNSALHSGQEFAGVMAHANIPLDDEQLKNVRRFMTAWNQKLLASKASVISAPPFGWTPSGNSFSYGGHAWTKQGQEPCKHADAEMERRYSPTGLMDPWQTASDWLCTQARPDLHLFLAHAFGAPLMNFVGQEGALLSTYSTGSGAGKSTAIKIAQAVWGHPKFAGGVTDTTKATQNVMGTLSHLPMYWDELKGKRQTDAFVEMLFSLSHGRENLRLTQNIQQRQAGEWKTILLSASNSSILEKVHQVTKDTNAGIMRVLECEIQPVPRNTKVKMDIDGMIRDLEENYGHAGLIYAQWLGKNVDTVRSDIKKMKQIVTSRFQMAPEERLWTAMLTSLFLGAQYANDLKLTAINAGALAVYLRQALDNMRHAAVTSGSDMSIGESLTSVLNRYLQDKEQEYTLWTDRIVTGPGRPAKGGIQLEPETNLQRFKAIHVQRGKDGVIHMNSTRFRDWCERENLSPTTIVKEMKNQLHAKTKVIYMGAGTQKVEPTKIGVIEILQSDIDALTDGGNQP